MNEQYLKRIIYRVNMVSVLMDIIDQFMTELPQDVFKQRLKELYKISSKQIKRFVREVDANLCPASQEAYGEVADEIRDYLDKTFNKIEDEKQAEKG